MILANERQGFVMKHKSSRMSWLSVLSLLAVAASGLLAQENKTTQPATAPAAAPTSSAPRNESTPPTSDKGSTAASEAQGFPPDKVVLKVGSQQATVADLEFAMQSLPREIQKQMVTQGRRPLGDQYSLLLALSQKAAAQHLDDSPDLRRQLNQVRMQLLAQAEYRQLTSDVKVTPEEVSQYFSAHQSEFAALDIRQASVRKKMPNAAATAPGLTEDEARAKAEEIRKALQAGGDPKKVAEDFKMPNVIFIDPEPRTVRHGQLPANLEEQIFKLKDGEFSDFQDNPQVVYFVQVIKHTQSELKDASADIENKLKDQKVQEALNAVKAQASIWMDAAFFAAPTPAPPPAPMPAASTSLPGSNAQPAAANPPPKPESSGKTPQ